MLARIGTLLFLLASTHVAEACSCEPTSETKEERLTSAFRKAATVAIMQVVSFEQIGAGDDSEIRTSLQFKYLFKQSETSSPPYIGRGAYDATPSGSQIVSSCDIELDEGSLVIAFADERGIVHFGGCSPASGPIDFDALPLLYRLKGEHSTDSAITGSE